MSRAAANFRFYRLSSVEPCQTRPAILSDPQKIPFSTNWIRQRIGKGKSAANGFHLHLCYERQITSVICASRHRKAKTSRARDHRLCMTAATLRRNRDLTVMLARAHRLLALKGYLKRFNLLWIFERPINLRRGAIFPHRARQRQHEARRAARADNTED